MIPDFAKPSEGNSSRTARKLSPFQPADAVCSAFGPRIAHEAPWRGLLSLVGVWRTERCPTRRGATWAFLCDSVAVACNMLQKCHSIWQRIAYEAAWRASARLWRGLANWPFRTRLGPTWAFCPPFVYEDRGAGLLSLTGFIALLGISNATWANAGDPVAF